MKSSICTKALNSSCLSEKEVKSLLKIAISAANKGGEVLKKYYGNLKSIKNKGRVGDLVTNADIEAEKIVIDYLSKETPDIAILAEESGITNNKIDLKWCVDPLDGTTNFAHGYPFFATSIGLTYKDLPLLGSISIPFLNENYSAAPGLGAFCNNNKIQVSKTTSLSNSLLVTGFAYDRHNRLDNNYAEFCWLTHRTRGVRRGGAAAVDLAFIASGRLDGYWERGLAKWDLAAGVAIVNEAGGSIKDYKNKEFNLESGRILACTPKIEKEILQELSKVKPLEGKLFGAPEIKA